MSLKKRTSVWAVGDPVYATDLNSTLLAGDMISEIPLGESFTGATSPQPCVVINDLEMPIFDGISTFGSAGTPQRSVKIIPRQAATVSRIITALYRTTDPGTNLSIEIQTDSSGLPSNTPITNGTSATIATSTLVNNDPRYFNFTFSTPPALVAGTTYHIVLKTSATNANVISAPTLTNALKYASFSGASYNGTSWSANQPIPYFEIITATGGSKSLWRSDGNGVEPLNGVDGFCVTTGSAGADGIIIRGGSVDGFTLQDGSDYYLSNTIGTITVNKDEGIFVGTAESGTVLSTPRSKIKQRNARYLTLLFLGSGSGWLSVPFLAYEDGVVTLVGTAATINGSSCFLAGHVGATHADATSPSNAGTFFSGFASTTSINISSNMSFPVKKGDRVQVYHTNPGGSGGTPSLSSLYFQPLS